VSGSSGKRSRRKPIDLKGLNGYLSELVEMLHFYAVDPYRRGEDMDRGELIRLSHAFTQAAGVHRAVLADLAQAQRDEAIERLQEQAADVRGQVEQLRQETREGRLRA